MNSGICMCVLLVTLSASCLRRACCSAQRESHAHSAAPDIPAADGTHNTAASLASTNLSELLTKLMAKKASLRKNSTSSKWRASGVSSKDQYHQMKDRDYLGWMDFGRRSAEEYEYPL